MGLSIVAVQNLKSPFAESYYCLYYRRRLLAAALLVPRETGTVSSAHISPSSTRLPFQPHPLAVSLQLAKEVCEQSQEAVHVCPRLSHGRRGVHRRAHTRTFALPRTSTKPHTLSVSQTSTGPIQQQRELPDSLLSISRHAAEKEEFHFWSLRRVRKYTPHHFPSSLCLSRRTPACESVRLIAVSLFDDCADSLSVFFSACLFDQLLWERRHTGSFCPPTLAFVRHGQQVKLKDELCSARVMSRMSTDKQHEETGKCWLQEHRTAGDNIGSWAVCRLSALVSFYGPLYTDQQTHCQQRALCWSVGEQVPWRHWTLFIGLCVCALYTS